MEVINQFANAIFQIVIHLLFLVAMPVAIASRIFTPFVWAKVAILGRDTVDEAMEQYPNPKDHPNYR